MSKEHVGHAELVRFAGEKVNLPADWAKAYREQANGLITRLEKYVDEHPDFTLRRIMMSGSLPKGTALKTLNDIDVACYISGADAPREVNKLIEYLAERLRSAYPNFKPEQVKAKTYSVTVSFLGSGLDVDVVPVLYEGDPEWYGNLVSQEDGSFLKTCIPRHIQFIKKRKGLKPTDFVQVIRLAKYWVQHMKEEKEGFRFKSFMVELIMSKLLDEGADFSDYPEALQQFFTYIIKTDMRKLLAFNDYYPLTRLGNFDEPVKIIDPVNEQNNAAKLYTSAQADAITSAATDAGDAIDAAFAAPTKQLTVYYWQKVFGSTFQL